MNNASFFDQTRDRFRGGLAELSGKWGWYLALGVFLVILGVIATGSAVATTLLSVIVVGWVLLVSGAGLVIFSFLTGKWSGFLLSLAAGVLSIIAGIELLGNPVAGAVAITMVIGTVLLVAGVFRSISAIAMRFPNWGWALLSGIVTFALGVILVRNWQVTALWFLGFAVGIDLILHGISWMAFALGIHHMGRDLEITGAERRAA
jgi:uncharacterized membrane protein HdeD (DUF308 family)